MKVADVMTKDVLWLEADEPVSLAAWTMAAEFISGAPVRDRAGKLVGVLSNADLARTITPVLNTRVSGLMSSAVVSISEDASLAEAVHLFAERGVHRIIVTNSTGGVSGVLTALDVLRGIQRSGGIASTA